MVSVIATIPVGSWPIDVVVSPDGGHAYVANQTGGTVSVIDTNAKTVTATIGFGANPAYPTGVVVHPDGTRLYVARLGVVSVVDTATNAVISEIPVSDSWLNLAIHPDGSKLYVATELPDGTVAVIDTTTESVVNVIDLGGFSAIGLATSPDGTRVWVITDTGLWGLNTATNSSVTTASVDSPVAVAVSPDSTLVYVIQHGSSPNTLKVLDIDTLQFATFSVTGFAAAAMAIEPDGAQLYVASLDGVMSVVNTATNTVTSTVQVGDSASAVAVTPGGSNIYVTNQTDNTVSVLSTTPSWKWPGDLPDLVGDLLGGVAGDGGGWLVIGNHFYKIPPRPLAAEIIARALAPHLSKPIENRKLAQQIRNMSPR